MISDMSLLTIRPIDTQAYQPSSLLTINPIDHQAYRPYMGTFVDNILGTKFLALFLLKSPQKIGIVIVCISCYSGLLFVIRLLVLIF